MLCVGHNTLHTPAHPSKPLYTPVHPSTPLYTPVHPCTPLHTPAHPCVHIVQVYLHVKVKVFEISIYGKAKQSRFFVSYHPPLQQSLLQNLGATHHESTPQTIHEGL